MRRYDSRAGAGPSRTAVSASRTCGAARSASEYTATVRRPSSRAERRTRRAISPRLATSRVSKVTGSSRGGGHEHAQRRGVEVVAGVVDLRAVRDDDEQVDLGAERDALAGAGHAVDDPEGTVGFHGDVHEPVEVGHEVAGGQAVPGALGEEVLPAPVLVHGVVAVPQGVRLLAAGAADGVLAFDLVGHDGREGAPYWLRSTVPVRTYALPCHARVSGTLYRSLRSASENSRQSADWLPPTSTMVRTCPARTTADQGARGATRSSRTTSPVTSGEPQSSVLWSVLTGLGPPRGRGCSGRHGAVRGCGWRGRRRWTSGSSATRGSAAARR